MPKSSNPCKVIVAYYSGFRVKGEKEIAEIDASKLTHINYAFASISNGKIVPASLWVDTMEPIPGCPSCSPKGKYGQLVRLKQKYPDLKTLISVGGVGFAKQFSDSARNKASRDRFSASAVDFVRRYKFDGVDIDWEFPVLGDSRGKGRAADRKNYSLMLQNLRQALDKAGREDGKHYLLTVAIGVGPDHVRSIEVDKVQQYTDWINLMTYDYHGPWESTSNHNAPLYADPKDPAKGKSPYNVSSSVNQYIKAGLRPSHIVLGIPLYGRAWTQCNPANRGQYQKCPGKKRGYYLYRDLAAKYINKNGYTRYWNDASKVPYLFNPTNREFISYDDAESIAYKLDYVLRKNLRGVMTWEYDDYLINLIYETLSRSSTICEAL